MEGRGWKRGVRGGRPARAQEPAGAEGTGRAEGRPRVGTPESFVGLGWVALS